MIIERRKHWIEETVQHIAKQLHHPYLHKTIGTPEIDMDRLSLLMLPFFLKKTYTSRDQSYVSTAILIQQALDTHEKVSAEKSSLKSRQLTVLAGDYYSGLYYKILSGIPDIELIRKIAYSIQEINEYKIEITSNRCNSVEQFLKRLGDIESSIITGVFEHLSFTEMIPLAKKLLLIKRLQKEEELYGNGKHSFVFSSFENSFMREHTPGSVMKTIEKIIQQLKKEAEELIAQLKLPEDVRKLMIFEQLSNRYEHSIFYAEEG
ncbi:heptaprenyl diphosphate synthase component 1 [Jeotgalibacillus aurantiacus]|uniref:heptaprenyl diphosphate synthase component 1 n=1 Tax=Jeotgalibacillus aurantiacus TaxID=2763266 RepID=UPI001D0B0CF2|nr:heptaprenyl diphosphate synthase component 1 [Jeotgalibacillus aurantiacus]